MDPQRRGTAWARARSRSGPLRGRSRQAGHDRQDRRCRRARSVRSAEGSARPRPQARAGRGLLAEVSGIVADELRARDGGQGVRGLGRPAGRTGPRQAVPRNPARERLAACHPSQRASARGAARRRRSQRDRRLRAPATLPACFRLLESGMGAHPARIAGIGALRPRPRGGDPGLAVERPAPCGATLCRATLAPLRDCLEPLRRHCHPAAGHCRIRAGQHGRRSIVPCQGLASPGTGPVQGAGQVARDTSVRKSRDQVVRGVPSRHSPAADRSALEPRTVRRDPRRLGNLCGQRVLRCMPPRGGRGLVRHRHGQDVPHVRSRERHRRLFGRTTNSATPAASCSGAC